MKKYFKYAALACAALGLGGTIASCQDDFDDKTVDVTAPVATKEANMTIFDLKKMCWNDATNYIYGMEDKEDAELVPIGTREDGSHYIIAGRVVSSDEEGNIFKSLVIQDETAAIALSVNSYNLYLNYRIGQEIVLDVTGMYVGKYNGLLQIGYPEWYTNGNVWEASFMAPEFFVRHRELNGWPDAAKVDTLVVNSISDIPSSAEGLMRWQSQLVRINNVEFVNGGKETFSTYQSSGVNQALTDAEGTSINVRTSGYSTFWSATLPAGRGDVVGILSYYGTSGWQFMLNDLEGCMNFGNPTLTPGAEDNPYTVDQAVAVQIAGQSRSGWVTGYIVGAPAAEKETITGNGDVVWSKDVDVDNTLVIGQTADTKDIAHALVIALPAGSKLRQLGNLMDNPDNYGKQIWIRGSFAQVMGTYGVTDNSGAAGTWRIEGVEAGGGSIANGDGTQASPYSAAQVQAGTGTGTIAWVKGYIIGSSNGKTAAEMTVGADNASASNIFIAATPDETNYANCVPVQLPTGTIRSALNLQANPGNVGKVVSVYGSCEKYFGQNGVKAITEYELEGGDTPTPPTPSEGSGTEADPYTVGTVIGFNPQSTTESDHKGVWVKGYIVGWADLSSEFVVNANTAKFTAPATIKTNLLMAATADCKDYTKCIAVQLPTGSVREALNLQDNAANLGKELLIQGDVMKYCGVAGIKNASSFKLDGGTPDPGPGPEPTVVTSLDENFDASTSIPAGWTIDKVAGNKDWYVREFSGNNYATVSGYQGTPPFDAWLISPGIDMSKATSKKLTFDTQVNGYGSTTSALEVYVLTGPSASSGKTQLHPALAQAPASGYSSWVASGELDLSAYTGVIYIGFRYAATQDANYATWCVDNVKLNAGGSTPDPDPTPDPTPSGDYKGDFNSFNGGEAKASPYGTYTNATGWTAENAIILGGTDGADANPLFTFIGATGTLAPTLNGRTDKVGRLISPVLTGGCGTLTFSYGFAFAEKACSFRVDIKDASGAVVKTDTVTLETIAQKQAYSYSLDVNVSGNFSIEITNLCATNTSTGNKDRVSIWNLTWTSK